MTARAITWILATRQSSPFYYRRGLVVVPNVSWGLLPWEADLIHCSKSGFLSEVEIKISMADWKADLSKQKWRGDAHGLWIKSFWYAAPPELAQRFQEVGIPDTAGVISVSKDGLKILRYAAFNRTAKCLSEREITALCRLGAIKAWDRHDPAHEQTVWAEETRA